MKILSLEFILYSYFSDDKVFSPFSFLGFMAFMFIVVLSSISFIAYEPLPPSILRAFLLCFFIMSIPLILGFFALQSDNKESE